MATRKNAPGRKPPRASKSKKSKAKREDNFLKSARKSRGLYFGK